MQNEGNGTVKGIQEIILMRIEFKKPLNRTTKDDIIYARFHPGPPTVEVIENGHISGFIFFFPWLMVSGRSYNFASSQRRSVETVQHLFSHRVDSRVLGFLRRKCVCQRRVSCIINGINAL